MYCSVVGDQTHDCVKPELAELLRQQRHRHTRQISGLDARSHLACPNLFLSQVMSKSAPLGLGLVAVCTSMFVLRLLLNGRESNDSRCVSCCRDLLVRTDKRCLMSQRPLAISHVTAVDLVVFTGIHQVVSPCQLAYLTSSCLIDLFTPVMQPMRCRGVRNVCCMGWQNE